MTIVSDHLRTTIARHIAEHHIVLWLDPEGHYSDLVDQLALRATTVVRYQGSFFALRHALDGYIARDDPPDVLIYVPRDDDATLDALAEVAATAAVLRPGQAQAARNTRLAVVARRALRERLGDERAEELARQVEAGQLSLAELDRLDEQAGGSPVIVAIFGTANLAAVALTFLSTTDCDAQIVERHALPDLARSLGPSFGLDLAASSSCDDLRTRLARHVLTTEFLAELGGVPIELATIPLPEGAARAACVELAHSWRQRRDLQESYARMADQVAAALDLGHVPFGLDEIRTSATFALVEEALQAAVESALIQHPTAELLDLALQRQTGFWAMQRPALQARWALVHSAGQLLAEAHRVEQALKRAPEQPEALLRAYAEGEEPWCQLDTVQRTLERRWHTYDLADNQHIEQLVTQARQRFMQVGDTLAERFTRALAAARCQLPGITPQRNIFATSVQPAMREGKTAYVLVDAMRFEMARELSAGFGDEFSAQLTVAFGTLPSITPIGMAALLPGVERGTIVQTRDGKLAWQVGSTQLKDRRTRIEWLRQQISGSVAVTTLEELLPKPKAALHNELQAADFILVTSQEIDELAESDNIRLARKVMDDALADLARLVRKLREYDCRTIILTADHGYLFGDELESDMKIDPPGGQTILLKRRAWVGRGAEQNTTFLRTSLAQLGLSAEDLEIAVPWGFGAFKASGGRAYFHGGASPQELAIPVLRLTPRQTSRITPLASLSWSLQPGTKKLTTRFFSVQITGQSNGLFELEPPRVRLELYAQGKVVSQPIGATYGLNEATGEITLRAQPDQAQQIEPNTITLMVTSVQQKTVMLQLSDATSGRELSRIERIEVTMLEL
ncbi:MAG: PglZ domain-containing protein [Candidatus Viridilinea halotolerans]|uniref:PglZ domain-containing protein n=1 Tax=Candidatus Viridilinea halotolerans TaxID=2491704 RepID=A0A426TSS5_9CHLR|nr:MAG: PglZ domain-containing protein [Candidatus Viridilinea halotolerans]